MRVVSIFADDATEDDIRLTPGLETLDEETAGSVSAYLWAGTLVAAPRHRVPDPLRADSAPVVPISTATDGSYIWSHALAYFVKTYLVSPGAEFLEHCRSHDFVPPTVSEADLRAVLDFLGY